MEKRRSKIWKCCLVMSMFIIGGLFLLNGKKVEAKYQYSIKKQTITDSGVFQIQQKEDERIVLQFKPKKSGRYFIKIEAKGTGIDSAGIGFGQNGVFASSTTGTEGESVIHRESMYFEQGKICPITLGMGKYIGGAGDAIKSVACSYRLEIKNTGFRVQKLSTKKACSLSKKDYGIYVDGNHKEPIEPLLIFQPTKTGYYRFYGKNTVQTTANIWERKKDGSLEYFGGVESYEMIKLKKGKKYILNDVWCHASNKIMVQYAAGKRRIKLDCNYPWKNGECIEYYYVQKGGSLGVLCPPVPTECQFDGAGKNHKKYKFLGWYTKKKGGKKITAKTKKCQKIKKLYAHWKK